MISTQPRRNSSRIILLQLTSYVAATAFWCVLAFGITSSVGAQTSALKSSKATNKQLQQTQKALKLTRKKAKNLKVKADGLEKEIVEIRKDLIDTAGVILVHERRLAQIKSEIKRLESNHTMILSSFKLRRRQLGAVLAALQRIARNPPESLVAQPIAPVDVVRGTIVLGSTLYRLEEDARKFRKDLIVLNAARSEALKRREDFNQEMNKLNNQRARLRRLMGRKSHLRRRTIFETDRASKRALSLSKRAKSLRDLVSRLKVLGSKPDFSDIEMSGLQTSDNRQAINLHHKGAISKPVGSMRVSISPPRGFSDLPFGSRKGLIFYPVVGRLAVRYGHPIANGQTHKGLTLKTGKSAQVIAPYEGKVAFSGPFRSYGELLIIEHKGGYHTLLAGMARIDVMVGQWLLTGEPVGAMGREGTRSPVLYMEIRRNSQPINPLPWLAIRKDKLGR